MKKDILAFLFAYGLTSSKVSSRISVDIFGY